MAAGGRMNGLVPVDQFDQFEHLARPAMQADYHPDVAACWDALSRERDAYASGVEEDLVGGVEAAVVR